MRKYFVGYAARKGLGAVPQELSDEITWLADNVVKMRDLLVVHKHDKDEQVRLHLGTAYISAGSDEDAYFGAGIMYPTDDDVFPAEVKPSEIVAHFLICGNLWLEYLRSNRAFRVAQRLL